MDVLNEMGPRIRGVPTDEAIRSATNWWNNKGRIAMKQTAMRQAEGVGGSNKGNGSAFASLDPDSANFMPSGILHGFVWDDLDQREKVRVVQAWLNIHHPIITQPTVIT